MHSHSHIVTLCTLKLTYDALIYVNSTENTFVHILIATVYSEITFTYLENIYLQEIGDTFLRFDGSTVSRVVCCVAQATTAKL